MNLIRGFIMAYGLDVKNRMVWLLGGKLPIISGVERSEYWGRYPFPSRFTNCVAHIKTLSNPKSFWKWLEG